MKLTPKSKSKSMPMPMLTMMMNAFHSEITSYIVFIFIFISIFKPWIEQKKIVYEHKITFITLFLILFFVFFVFGPKELV